MRGLLVLQALVQVESAQHESWFGLLPTRGQQVVLRLWASWVNLICLKYPMPNVGMSFTNSFNVLWI